MGQNDIVYIRAHAANLYLNIVIIVSSAHITFLIGMYIINDKLSCSTRYKRNIHQKKYHHNAAKAL